MSFNIETLFREELLSLTPYSCARDEASIIPLIALDANENSFGAFANPKFNVALNRYPDSKQSKLKAAFAKVINLPSENIFVGNGSDEAIDLLIRAFCTPFKDSILINTPTYGMYEVSAKINQVGVIECGLDENFDISSEDILNSITSNTKIIFLCSPNNPTGNSLTYSKILDVLDRFNGIVVIDEAYIDFADQQSLSQLIRKYRNLVILQTMSKSWGLAGARVGFLLSDISIIQYLSRIKPPYNVSSTSQALAIDALSRISQVTKSIKALKNERNRLTVELKKLTIVREILPSETNFILVRFTDGKAAMRQLEKDGILVRDRSSISRLQNCLRITVGTPTQNTLLLNSLKQFDQRVFFQNSDTARGAYLQRITSETFTQIQLDLDQRGPSVINTGIGFLDHMLDLLTFHSGLTLELTAIGDLNVDLHHTVEDIALLLGQAIRQALTNSGGFKRYGTNTLMDEARSDVLIDISGRAIFTWEVVFSAENIGEMPTELLKHFFQSFTTSLGASLQISASGENNHHIAESIFKGVGRALREAVARNGDSEVLSTKGII